MAKPDREIERYKKALGIAVDALAVYANPESYHAVAFLFDRPCGDFADDFSRVKHPHYDRVMPGKVARAAFRELEAVSHRVGSRRQGAAEERKMDKIRIEEAKAIAERLGADAVVVLAFKGDNFETTSYGATKAKCTETGKWLDGIVAALGDGTIEVPRL